MNILGPQIEHYSAAQISALNTYVSNPFFGIITDPSSSLSGPTVPAYQLQVPHPQFTNFTGDSPPYADSNYQALQLQIEKRFSSGLEFNASYVFSKSVDDSSTTDDSVSWLGGIGSPAPQEPNNLRLDRSLSTFDIPQIAQFSYTYELPIGRGKRFGNHMPVVLDALIGGWQTNGIWRFAAGRPILPMLQGGQSLPTYNQQRPNLIGTPKRNTGSESSWINQYFANPEVFTTPAPFTLGDAARAIGSVRQPGSENGDASLFKSFTLNRLREGMRIEFRFEAFNVFNHPVFSGPNTTVNSGNLGVITSTANSPRQAQAALKVYF